MANVTLRDLSAQKAAEAAYQTSQAVVANLQAAMDAHALLSTADKAGRITHVNDRFCAVSGYSREELLGQNHRLLRSGMHGRSTYQDLWSTLGAGKVWKSELCNRAKDGSLFWVDATIVPMQGPDKRRPHNTRPSTPTSPSANWPTSNGTSWRPSCARPRNSRPSARWPAASPTTSTTSWPPSWVFRKLMRDEIPPTGDAADYLSQIQKAGKRARELVQRILSFSRPQPTARKDVVLQDVVQETLAIASATLPASISLQRALQEAPVHVSADATQLQQVLINLYTNAWHAAPSRSRPHRDRPRASGRSS